MPVVPHYPSDEPDEQDGVTDVSKIVDRIVSGGDRQPSPGAV